MPLQAADPNLEQQAAEQPAQSAHDVETSNFLRELAGGADIGAYQPARKASKLGGYLLLALVVGSAAGVLFLMRTIGMRAHVAPIEFTLDYPLERIDAGALISGDHDRLLADLNVSNKVVQVPLENVQMNPFAWRSGEPEEAAQSPAGGIDPDAARKVQAEARRRELENAAGNLTLHSIMGGGRVPLAQISGKVVRIGDVIDDTFTVRAISGRTVELECEGHVFTLSLGESDAVPAGRGRQ